MGGWSASHQFDDLYILERETLAWSCPKAAQGPESWGAQRWGFSAVSVFAVPYWKIFVFGGNSGNLDASRPQGTHLNDIQVLKSIISQSGTDSSGMSWSRPKIADSADKPTPRADTEMFYSDDLGKLVLFGGWSNQWHDEVYTCEARDIVGPPYNIFSIQSPEWSSATGPVTGDSDMILNGKGLCLGPSGVISTVQFACPKGYIKVIGSVVDDKHVLFKTPNFEKYGALEVE
eukprot:15346827-Ditylum_brightwellii.AAC.1